MASEEAAAAAAADEGPPQVVRVKRELLEACLTCPICHKLLRDATTISECLHTFCRQCIYEKLTDEELDCCPICHTDLGVVPVEKLRPDHNLQDVRAKIFPFKRRKAEASEAVSPINLPVRRKERSLSSLVITAPRVATHKGLTGRRTRGVPRRASMLHGLSPVINDSIKKEDDISHRIAENSSSSENLSKLAQNRRQTSSNAESSSIFSNKDTETGMESIRDKAELWKPLNCLVEAANRTKSFKSSPHCSVVKAEQVNGTDSEVNGNKTRVKEQLNKSKVHDERNENAQSPAVKGKAKRFQGRKRKNLAASTQELLEAANVQRDRRMNPIWFSLIACLEQAGDPPLPQIPSSYLRIKDGRVPVSFIQKYLVKKLDLASEAEVEITFQGQSLNPTMSLHNLAEEWLREGTQKLQATIGTSAKEFVMVLAYRRRKTS